jgi:predicted flavoprotein YhiN
MIPSAFFEANGIFGKEKTLGQLFPVSNNAKDIVRVFESLCADLDQQIICNAEVKEVLKMEEGDFKIIYSRAGKLKEIKVPKVVIASGGLPIQKMGATDFGLKVAKQFGLKLTETAPALVPLTITGKDAEWYTQLVGKYDIQQGFE